MFFLGDLGGSAGIGRPFVKDLDFPLTNLSKTIYASYYPGEFLGFRFGINHGTIKGNDAQAPDKGGPEEDRRLRNLSFKSSILEGMLLAEIYPTVFFERYDEMKGKLRPYLVAGGGIFRMNPKAKDPATGKYVVLRPLRIEGQGMDEYPDRKQYSLMQLEIPFGGGVKYYLKENMYVGIEILHRQTMTDYLDNVSKDYIPLSLYDKYLTPANAAVAKRMQYQGHYPQAQGPTARTSIETFQRGDPTENDAFFSTVFRIGWRLNAAEDRLTRRQLRCPVFY